MKIAVYGAGSLGTILGAFIAKAGKEVHLINTNKAHVEALRERGAVITGQIEMTVPVTAFTPDEMEYGYNIAFLATKQVKNPEIIEFIKPRLAEDGVVVTLQNGLPEAGIEAVLGEDRVIGAIVEWGATLEGPGISRLTSRVDSLSYGIGRLNGKKDEALMRVKEVLELMCPVHIVDNFVGERFSKLLINASFSGMSAVLGSTFGQAAAEKNARRCIQYIIKECIDVAKAAGITIEPVQGKDIVKLLNFHGKAKRFLSFQIIPIAIKKHSEIKASMLQDLGKNKLTEVDYINGILTQYGIKYKVETPFNNRVVEIIHGIEQQRYKPEFANVKLFNDLLEKVK